MPMHLPLLTVGICVLNTAGESISHIIDIGSVPLSSGYVLYVNCV